MTVKLMQGNEAIALGAIAAGCRFYAGYPITPSTEVAEVLSHLQPKTNAVAIMVMIMKLVRKYNPLGDYALGNRLNKKNLSMFSLIAPTGRFSPL